MELLQLRYFLSTAKHEHITNAANSLHIAQPALSQSIRRLENELGVKLFERSGRGIKLSQAGKALENKLIPILDALDKIPRELSAISQTVAKTININILSASELVTKIIIDYKEIHPDIFFHLNQSRDYEDWDIRFSSITPGQSDDSRHTVLQEEIFLAVPITSKFSNYGEINLTDVKDESFISLEKSRPIRAICDNYCISEGFTPQIVYESDNPQTVKDLIGAGLGVSFWPQYSWGVQNSEKVKLLHIKSPACTRQLIVTEKSREPSLSVVQDFYLYVLNYLNNIK